MAELNRQEQAYVDEAERLETAYRAGETWYTTRAGTQVPLTEAVVQRVQELAENQRHNAEAREQRLAALKAEEDAKVAKREAARDAAGLAARDRFWREQQATWQGTAAEFEQLKGRLWQEELLRRAQASEAITRTSFSGLNDGS